MNKKTFADRIKAFDFINLFIELGWDRFSNIVPIAINNEIYNLSGIVEKRGFAILLCPPSSNGDIPDNATRKKIENNLSKTYHEHLVIFENKAKTKQVWQFVVNEKDKPKRVREIIYDKNQDPEILYQRARGLLFTLDEEENITLIDVIARFNENFGKNAEQVTKKFYDEFKKHHVSFLEFIEGIDDALKTQDNKYKQWYASLMLNRLMFCYFIQKRGYLNNDVNYLQNKLKEVKEKAGKNKFYSFYRDFLLQLFHQGLGQPLKSRKLKVELGNIPYLNGGLFDVHELEKQFNNIQIEDEAFEKIFNFFDRWNWHLDSRIESTGRDINPDVIGYIFEKYINDRASMGAYYTKEDITDYIGKNTILPFLFDKVKREYPTAFKKDSYLWNHLKNSGDTYIYDAVKKGINEARKKDNPVAVDELNIPQNIAVGLDTTKPDLLERRKDWNTKTPGDFSLPTEIWRETIDRWKRYFDIKKKIANGEILEINDFITNNLNIRLFANSIIENIDDPEFIRHFYKAIHSVTILDPTCGSGAFLFAAMNILEPLYEACIERMEQFTSEEPRKYKYFHEELAKVNSAEHPNLKYYVFKTIILNNLYGVDIMHEAVEIAKLRLFLKMVGAVDINLNKTNYGLEPLPDIDFNIRAGNTLVGFATEKELENAVQQGLDFGENTLKKFKEECGIIATAFKNFQDSQLVTDKGEESHRIAKAELQNKLYVLNSKLNVYLAKTYGIDEEAETKANKKKFNEKYNKWLESHYPFHWFAEFYEIINGNGGFDIVIGNPPYLSINKIDYDLKFQSFSCSDLYGYVIHRAITLLHKYSRHGFIVMHNLAFSNSYKQVREFIYENMNNSWFSFFARIPAGLFSGDVRVRNCIYFIEKNSNLKVKKQFTTRIHRWFSETRSNLIDKIAFTEFQKQEIIPMFNDSILAAFYNKAGMSLKKYIVNSSKHKLYFKQSAYNWIAISKELAPCYNEGGKEIEQTQVKEICFTEEWIADTLLLFFNGKICFSHWLSFGDEFHITKDDLLSMVVPLNQLSTEDKESLLTLSKKFQNELPNTIQYKLNACKKVGTYNTSLLWNMTDISDLIFLKYMCNNSAQVVDAIDQHVFSTVLTINNEEDENDEGDE